MNPLTARTLHGPVKKMSGSSEAVADFSEITNK